MKIEHLSDHDIQQFAFDPSECSIGIIEHVSSCSVCKKRVENYVVLSNKIKNLPEPSLGFDLSDQVLRQLEISPEKKSMVHYFIYFLIGLSTVLVFTCLFYFKEVFIDLFKSSSAISTFLIISVALLISLTMVLDMLRSYNKKINMLN